VEQGGRRRVIRETTDCGVAGLMVAFEGPPDAVDREKAIYGYREYGERRLAALKAAGFEPGQGPKRFPFIGGTPWTADSGVTCSELAIMARIGFNAWMQNGGPASASAAADAAELGLPSLFTQCWSHQTHYAVTGARGADFVNRVRNGESVPEYWKRQWEVAYPLSAAHLLPALRSQVRFVTMGDEVALMDYHFRTAEEAAKQPGSLPSAYQARFHDYLKCLNLAPSFFGKAEWSQVGKIARPADDAPLADRRLFYHVQRFRQLDSARDWWPNSTAAVHRSYGPQAQTVVNLGNVDQQIWNGGDAMIDPFDLLRFHGIDQPWLEDWTGTNDWTISRAAFGLDLYRSAAEKHGGRFGGYLCDWGATGRISETRYWNWVARGAKTIVPYPYGPSPETTEYAFGDRTEAARQLGRFAREVAPIEDVLVEGKCAPADAALLWSQSGWFWKMPFWYRWLHTMLVKDYLPLDFVAEQEIAGEGVPERYRLLCAADPVATRAAQEAIKRWVAAGGTLLLTADALTQDEYLERSTLLDEVIGVRSRRLNAPPAGDPLPNPVGKIRVTGVPGLAPFTFAGQYRRARVEPVPGAQVLATWEDDGSPALLQHRYGKGTCIYAGTILQGSWLAEHWGLAKFPLHNVPVDPADGAGLLRFLDWIYERVAHGQRQYGSPVRGLYLTRQDAPAGTVLFVSHMYWENNPQGSCSLPAKPG
jgi:hypothetical protein